MIGSFCSLVVSSVLRIPFSRTSAQGSRRATHLKSIETAPKERDFVTATASRMVKLELEFEDGRRETVAILRQRVQKSGEEALELLRGAKVCVSKPPQKEVDPEKVLERERLRRRVEEMDYQKLVQNVARDGGQPTNRTVLLDTNVSIGLNMIAGMGTMFFVGVLASRTMFSDTKWHLVGGLVGCVLMMILEMTLYINRHFGLQQVMKLDDKDATSSNASESLTGGKVKEAPQRDANTKKKKQ